MGTERVARYRFRIDDDGRDAQSYVPGDDRRVE
jgi:hypothetical protein